MRELLDCGWWGDSEILGIRYRSHWVGWVLIAVSLLCVVVELAGLDSSSFHAPLVFFAAACFWRLRRPLNRDTQNEPAREPTTPPVNEPAEQDTSLVIANIAFPLSTEEIDVELASTKVLAVSLAGDEISRKSIIRRLLVTEKFSREQLELIDTELGRSQGTEVEASSQQEAFPNGTVIGGYCLEGLLSRGGTGRVYRARSIANQQRVAIKVLHCVNSTDRFRREMELVQHLAHPNIVVAYDVGEYSGLLYIAMELLSGPDLNMHVRQSGPLSWQESLGVLEQSARGLEHAHGRGLIHRDVKPGNLLRDEEQRIKVTDLGLATLTADEVDGEAPRFNTEARIVAGTLDFMAPEQARSLADATVYSDIYSLGATWFYLLTGRSRVRGKSLNEKLTCLLVDKRFRKLPETIAPDEVRKVYGKMIAYHPENRYKSMTEVIDALESIRPSELPASIAPFVHVLVVEDNRDDLFLTVEMLKRINKSVTVNEAYNLKQAIERAADTAPLDLVLLDLQLPDSFGVETVTQLRLASPEVPIIVLTGQNDTALENSCMAAGANGFARKNDLNAHLLERLIFITLSRWSPRSSNS